MTYDHVSDAAKIYLVDSVAFGEVARSTQCELDLDAAAMNLDFGHDGRLLSIELLGASRVLPGDYDFTTREPLDDLVARDLR
jgi:Protein of unknown function (DUF2283)